MEDPIKTKILIHQEEGDQIEFNDFAPDATYLELFIYIRDAFPNHKLKRISLLNLLNPEAPTIEENGDLNEKIIFDGAQEREEGGERFLLMDFDLFFTSKRQFKLFF